MKATVEEMPRAPEFRPFRLVLEIGTVEESHAVYSIFNHAPIVEPLRLDSVAESIRRGIEKFTPNVAVEHYPTRQRLMR